jgi:23S rRNA (guanosine2251-2'-O)-methyltransferase
MPERPPRKDRPGQPGKPTDRPRPPAGPGARPPGGTGQRRGGKPPAPRRPERQAAERRGPDRPNPNELWLFGEHAVLAAIKNQRRTCHQLLASEDGMPRIRDAAAKRGLRITPLPNAEIAKRLPRGAVHQGVAMHVAPLPPLQLERVIAIQPKESLLLALDQVTDPRNFGAILRSAAALGVGAVIVPERRSAELGGTTAKAASGALDMVPIVEVVNLSRALQRLKEADFRISGLDAAGSVTIDAAAPAPRRVLVIGSEGDGMRRLTTENCDETLSIPIDRRIDSLNVSVAASLALYALTRKATVP